MSCTSAARIIRWRQAARIGTWQRIRTDDIARLIAPSWGRHESTAVCHRWLGKSGCRYCRRRCDTGCKNMAVTIASAAWPIMAAAAGSRLPGWSHTPPGCCFAELASYRSMFPLPVRCGAPHSLVIHRPEDCLHAMIAPLVVVFDGYKADIGASEPKAVGVKAASAIAHVTALSGANVHGHGGQAPVSGQPVGQLSGPEGIPTACCHPPRIGVHAVRLPAGAHRPNPCCQRVHRVTRVIANIRAGVEGVRADTACSPPARGPPGCPGHRETAPSGSRMEIGGRSRGVPPNPNDAAIRAPAAAPFRPFMCPSVV